MLHQNCKGHLVGYWERKPEGHTRAESQKSSSNQEGDGRQNISGKGAHVQNSRGERGNSVWREPSLVMVLRVTQRGNLREESGEEEEAVMKSHMGHTKEYGFHPEG